MKSSVFVASVLLISVHIKASPLPQSMRQSILRETVTSSDSILEALTASEVIPHVLHPSFSPLLSLSISYPSSHETVDLGNDIPTSSTQSRPVFQISALISESLSLTPTRTLAENKTFVLALSDPDATSYSKPVKAQMCHWILTGVRTRKLNGSEGLEAGEIEKYALDLASASSGENERENMQELVSYMPPAPPKGTGRHRYVFVLLDSKVEEVKMDDLKKPNDRPHWGYKQHGNRRPGVEEWANDNGLVAVAANFFYAEHGT